MKQQAVEERSKRLCKFSTLLNFQDYLQEILRKYRENIEDAAEKSIETINIESREGEKFSSTNFYMCVRKV